MTDALVQTSHSITLSRGISLTETGAVIDDGVSLDAWGEALQQCQSLANASIWALGDLLVYAQNHAEWGETYTQFLELTGKSYSTLTKASYLSRQYASTDRVEGLSWSHHMEAAAIKIPTSDESFSCKPGRKDGPASSFALIRWTTRLTSFLRSRPRNVPLVDINGKVCRLCTVGILLHCSSL